MFKELYGTAGLPSCAKCSKPGSEILRESWGCDKPAPPVEKGGFRYQLGKHELDRCPNSLLDLSFVGQAVELYAAYKQGNLPQEGGIAGQTACYRRTMALLSKHEGEASDWFQKVLKSRHDNKGPGDGAI